jgi:hypothetical protein
VDEFKLHVALFWRRGEREERLVKFLENSPEQNKQGLGSGEFARSKFVDYGSFSEIEWRLYKPVITC